MASNSKHELFRLISASGFLRNFVAPIKSWRWKLRGKDYQGNPIDFTEADKVLIRKGLVEFKKRLKI